MTSSLLYEEKLKCTKQIRSSVFVSGVFAAILMSTPSYAHQTYLMPSEFVGKAHQSVDVALTSALSFPDRTSGPARDRISFVTILIGDHEVDEIAFEENETVLNATFVAHHAGFALAAMSSKPRSGKIEAENADEYFDEIGASQSVRQAFDELPGEPPLNRSYSKHAKTYFCIEICTGEENRAMPVGQKLEFVASGSGKGTFQLLLDGNALAGQNVTVTSFKGEQTSTTTNESGAFTTDESSSGIVMLSAVWITLPDSPDGVYHSDYATLTLDLKN